MRFLATEKLSSHKYKTPEGYLVCVDAVLSRTGKQEYYRSELFGDSCEDADKKIAVNRLESDVFDEKALASFENKPVCIEHPNEDVNVANHNELSVGFVRDIKRGKDNGQDVMLGTLVITDESAISAIESGEYTELSCGYDCDIRDEENPRQTNIRGNHVALCKHGRAGIARIVDSISDDEVDWLIALDEHGIKYSFINGGYAMKFKSNADYALARKLASIHHMTTGYWDDKALTHSDYRSTTISNNDSKDMNAMKDTSTTYNGFMHMLQQYSMHAQQLERIVEAIRGANDLSTSEKQMLVAKANSYLASLARMYDSVGDIQATSASGTDRIIYVMQSDVDENLFFYIGKTFSMKEGMWGYTKFEMGSTTPDELKADLTKHGWHQVAKGPAKIIDTSNEEWTVVEKENYEKANDSMKKVDINDDWSRGVSVVVKVDTNSLIDAAKNKKVRIGYGDANPEKLIGQTSLRFRLPNGDDTAYLNLGRSESSIHYNIYDNEFTYKEFGGKSDFNKAKLTSGLKNLQNYVESQLRSANIRIYQSKVEVGGSSKFNSTWRQAQSYNDSMKDSKERRFTIEYKQDGAIHIHTVRANSIEDAISKVKDVYNKFEHETDKEYLKSSINEMSRYISNWSFMTTREKRNISPEGLGALKQMLKFAQQRLSELK